MKTSNPYLLQEIEALESIMIVDASQLEVVQEIESLRAELEKANLNIESAFKEGYSAGYHDGLDDGQSYSGTKSSKDASAAWSESEAIQQLKGCDK